MATTKPVILVTGASRGIGLAATRILLKEHNANVVALSRTESQELRELATESLFFVPCDIQDEKSLVSAISQAESHYGHLDGLVLNAATLDPLCRIGDETPLSEWKTHFDINFFSLVTAVKAALPALRKSEFGGRIVFVSSGAAVKGMPGWGPYNASKAAMNSLCRTLAEEEAQVTSIAVRPGVVDTQMQINIRDSKESAIAMGKFRQHFVDLHTKGELLEPAAPAQVIAGLALSVPKELSGQFVSWDGEECKAFRS